MELDGTRVRNIRHRLGLTQAALSKKAGYAARTIQRVEAGEAVQSPTAAHIAQALNVRIDEITPRSDGLSSLIPQDPLSNEVTLVHCLSGRQLHGQLSKTTFLEIERDLEPRREQRDALRQFGALIEAVWQDPWIHPLERPNRCPSEGDIFDQMIEAGEILEALSDLRLKVMVGTYLVRDGSIIYTEDMEVYASNRSTIDHPKLILCVTDATDETLSRKPDDHYLSDLNIAKRRGHQESGTLARETLEEDDIPF